MCSTWHDLQFHLWCSGQQPNVSKHCLNLNFVTRTSLSVWVGVDFANQESVLVQQHSGGLQLIRQGLPAAAHPLHRSGGVGVTQAVPELRKRLPQLFLIPMRRKKNSSDSMVINTYVSCLISIANKHIIMHPVHLPHTQHRTWGPEISHTYTWVISLSAAGVLAQLLLFKTFTKHHLAGGNQSEQSFLQSFNWVFSSRVLAVLLFSSEQKSTLLDQKIPQEKSDTIYLAPALRWKTGASLPRGTAALRDADTSHRGCYKTLRL